MVRFGERVTIPPDERVGPVRGEERRQRRLTVLIASVVALVGLGPICLVAFVVYGMWPHDTARPSWAEVAESLEDWTVTLPQAGEPRDLREGNGFLGNTRDLRVERLSIQRARALLRALKVAEDEVDACLGSLTTTSTCAVHTGFDSRRDGQQYGWMVDVTLVRAHDQTLTAVLEAGQSYN